MASEWTAWRRLGRELCRAGLDALLPPVCAACGVSADAVHGELCDGCRRQLLRRPDDGCRRCGEVRLPGRPCQGDHRALRLLARLYAPFSFAACGGRLVRRFKLDGDAAAGRFLVRAMADCYRADRLPLRPVLASVPLHRARRRQRGFDQAAWLARGLAERLGLRLLSGALVRERATRPQGSAMVVSRAANVRGAFAVRESAAVEGRTVLLVDDVFTTGATARACAAELRRAGARSVAMLVACRS